MHGFLLVKGVEILAQLLMLPQPCLQTLLGPCFLENCIASETLASWYLLC